MIANVALPKIQGTFACTQDQIALVVTFNIVATAVVTPASGWLASRFSRRNILISCVSGFIISSTFCGFSQNLEQLVVFRILQGGQCSVGTDSYGYGLRHLSTKRTRNSNCNIWNGGGFGPIIGPTVGGFLRGTWLAVGIFSSSSIWNNCTVCYYCNHK